MSWFTRLFGERSRIARSSRPLPVRLRLEELEPRWVPSGLHPTSASYNWSGYAVSSTAGSVTAVSGTWTVPTMTTSPSNQNAFSSAWVGIDGYTSSSVEQTGIEADVVNGKPQYYAWYEMYPSGEVIESRLAIHAGDTISASVTYSGGLFTLTLTDQNDPIGSNSFTVMKSAPSAQRSSAEWIVEAPYSNDYLPLANFGSVTFSSATASITGYGANLSFNNPGWSNNLQALSMISVDGAVEDNAPVVNAAGTGFTVTYGAPGSTATTSTLTYVVTNPQSRQPTVTFTAVVSVPTSVPAGSEVELMSGDTIEAIGTLQNVGGVEEVSFTGSLRPGTYSFYAVYLGSGSQYQPDTSSTVTVNVR